MTDTLIDLSSRALFDAAVNAMLLVDDVGRVVLTNPAAQQLFGYTEDELYGLAVEKLIPARYQEKYRRYRALFFRKAGRHFLRDGKGIVALSHDGKELVLDVSLSPVKTQDRFYFLATFNIAGRRLQVEEALRTSEERLRLAKQAANLGIYDCDCKRKIIYWDEKKCVSFGVVLMKR